MTSVAMSVRRFLLLLGAATLFACPVPAADPPRNFDEEALQEAGLKTDGSALLEFFRKRTLSDADAARIPQTVRQLGARSFAAREQAATDLLALGRAARPYLREAVKDRDPEIAQRAAKCLEAAEGSASLMLPRAAARLLIVRQPPGTAAVVLSYLPHADDELLEDDLLAALAAVALRDGKAEPALVAALTDRSALRRSAAALVLGNCPELAVRQGVRPLLLDPEAKVRLRAAQGLVQGKDRAAVPVLVALLSEAPLPIAWSAEELLGRIAMEGAPQVWLGPGKEAERRACEQAWRTWWAERGKGVDLAKVNLEDRMLGLTLIACCDGYNGGKGKVWEIGPDGKTRWEINDVAYPVDAWMLPGNRVLIAEQSNRRITERDLSGRVLWEHKVEGGLVGAQRLRNGNTFVVTNSLIYEVSPDNKKVATYPGHAGTVYAGQKLRNGHVVYVSSNFKLTELDEQGKEIRAMKVDMEGIGLVKAESLPDGRWLVGQRKQLIEMDDTGKELWQSPVSSMASAQRLPNGNTLAAADIERRVVEVDRSGKVVWELKLEGGPVRVRRR